MFSEEKDSIILDLKNINTSKKFHELFQIVFDLSEYYGKNWNAFWDAITGMIELPEKIIFLHWDEFKQALPEDSEILVSTLNEYNEENGNRCEILYK